MIEFLTDSCLDCTRFFFDKQGLLVAILVLPYAELVRGRRRLLVALRLTSPLTAPKCDLDRRADSAKPSGGLLSKGS